MSDLELTVVPRDLYYTERKFVQAQADEIKRLRAALDIARSALLRIEQGSESARAALTRAAEALPAAEDPA